MSTFDLGTLSRVDLRNVWRHEAIDFTPWLLLAEVYIDLWDRGQNVLALEALRKNKSALEDALGEGEIALYNRAKGHNQPFINHPSVIYLRL